MSILDDVIFRPKQKIPKDTAQLDELTSRAVALGAGVQAFMQDITYMKERLEQQADLSKHLKMARAEIQSVQQQLEGERISNQDMLRRCFHGLLQLHPPYKVIGCDICELRTSVRVRVPVHVLMHSTSLKHDPG